MMTAYDRALEAVDALSTEDRALLLREGILQQIPFVEWPPVLFTGRSEDEVKAMVLALTLGFPVTEHVAIIDMLIDKLIDRWPPHSWTQDDRDSAAKLLRLEIGRASCRERV